MQIHRITPIPQETFYVVSGEGESLSPISSSPVCFSPSSYEIEKVDVGDIPSNAKIVSIDKETKAVQRINHGIMAKIINNGNELTPNDIVVALRELSDALIRNGIELPAYIQLSSFQQAYNLASNFEQLPGLPDDFSITKNMKPGESGEFWIRGVPFRWPSDQD